MSLNTIIEKDQQGLDLLTPTNANIEEELLDPVLPTATPVSPYRESKRRRSNIGGAAVTPCTPGITTSAYLWGSSSPLSSPPSSPQTPPLFSSVCINSGLCIRIYGNPGLKATRCHNSFNVCLYILFSLRQMWLFSVMLLYLILKDVVYNSKLKLLSLIISTSCYSADILAN